MLALAAWFVLHRISLPAFNTSMVTRSLATGASFVLIGIGAALAVLWSKGKRPWISSAVIALVPAGLALGSGPFALDLGVNAWGVLLCTLGFVVGAVAAPRRKQG